MKRIVITGVILGILGNIQFAGAADLHAAGHAGHSGNVQKNMELSPAEEILYAMHQPMMDEPFVESGSVERDFLSNMIPHHQGAVDSAKLYLQYGENKKIREMAGAIISAQEKEIAYFKELLNDPQALGSVKISKKEYKKFAADEKKNMEQMMEAMMDVSFTVTDADRMFAKAMIEHHKGAVAASRQILAYTKDETVRRIAETIIADQEKEISEFQIALMQIK